jgi:P-type Ca2+ transporter type 2C
VRYIRFQMAVLFAYIATFLGSSLFWIASGTPFLPLQTLWLNFSVQVFLAVGLGYGKAREGLMEEQPRPPTQPILGPRLLIWLIVAGFVMGIVNLVIIQYGTNVWGDAIGRTMGLTVFGIMNIWFALETANEDISLLDSRNWDNPVLLKTVGLSVVAVIATAELGFMNRVLDTVNLTPNQWGVCLFASLVMLIVPEARTLLRLRVVDPSLKTAAADATVA